MARYLIVANQTLGGSDLDAVVRSRVEQGDARFHVLVPMVEPAHEIATWAPADPMFGVPIQTEVTADALEEARQRSAHRLTAMINRVRDLGGQVDGEIGDTDPYRAVETVLERQSFDEVILSTLPAGISRWVRMDLPSRVERLAPCPVTTVEAQA